MKHLPVPILEDFSKFIGNRLGLHFPSEKWPDLERGIFDLAHQYHFTDPLDCIHWLKNTIVEKTQNEILASYFTVGETYFFRESGCFEVLEKLILPKIIEDKRKTQKNIRIWSAACSSGEEPYSIAILLTKLLPDISEWNITIIASDINLEALKKLKKGKYSEWSFRSTPSDIKENYFKKTLQGQGNRHYYQIQDSIKNRVIPLYLNLVEDSYPSIVNNTNAMDIIFCRNVLMYFLPEEIDRVIKKLHQALAHEGYLILGTSEYSAIPHTLFKTLNFKNTIIYQKANEAMEKGSQPLKSAVTDTDYLGSFTENLEENSFEESQFYQTPKTQFKDDVQELSNLKSEPETWSNQTQKQITEPTLEPQFFQDADPQKLIDQSQSLANQGQLNEALKIAEQIIAVNKCHPNARYLRALILQELKRPEEAILELKNALYLDKNFVMPYFSLGMIAYQSNKKTAAKKYFSIALSLVKSLDPETVLSGSEDLTVKRLIDIIHSSKLFNDETKQQKK